MKDNKKEQGITLIALMITIIVMLILVAVTVQITINGGIFEKAGEAVGKTKAAIENESNLDIDDLVHETITGITVEQVEDEHPGVLETKEGEDNTYIINSIEDLLFFANQVTTGNNIYAEKTVELGQSLDFESNKSYVNPKSTDYEEYGYEFQEGKDLKTILNEKGFIPIGKKSLNSADDLNGCVFEGTFDGKKNKIYNMKIQQNFKTEPETSIMIGMFSENRGTIQNLGLENININAEVECEGWAICGGIAAQNSVDAIIQNCYVTGNISVAVIGTTSNIGGLVGQQSGTLLNCYNKAEINISCSEYYWENPKEVRMGGLAGVLANGNDIRNVYNVGNIYYEAIGADGVYEKLGGLVGGLDSGSLKTSYTIGKIICRKNSKPLRLVGNLISTNSVKAIERCFYLPKLIDSQTTILYPNPNDGEEKTETEMKSPDFVEMLNKGQEGTPWKQDMNAVNNGYPILSWQEE